jgi:dolichol-phosphate mannosyltransferase
LSFAHPTEAALPDVSVVVPLYNERATVDELVERILRALDEVERRGLTPHRAELVLVDDRSSDGTGERLDDLAAREARIQVLHRETNGGQFGATRTGLRAARAPWVLTLDGDLQDPPETIVPLLERALAPGLAADVVFAVKAARYDDPVLLWGSRAYHAGQRLLASAAMPRGAGSFACMRRDFARRVGFLELPEANLAAALAAFGARFATVTYIKQRRAHGTSRVGFRRLVQEALGSMALTGALPRAMKLTGVLYAPGRRLQQRVARRLADADRQAGAQSANANA